MRIVREINLHNQKKNYNLAEQKLSYLVVRPNSTK